jgi:hypothetical protein
MSSLPAQLPCNSEIDYSEIVEDKILPFVIELDVPSSTLDPEPNENQRFCYNITGFGEDTSMFEDLNHLVLGICNEIPEKEIINVAVTVEGEAKQIEFGANGNVQLRTSENPDPLTGCPGLKFDFGLDKIDGEMTFCFELTIPRRIGPNKVCLFGSNVTADRQSICGPLCELLKNDYQIDPFSAPITVTPFTLSGEPAVFCRGEPVLASENCSCNEAAEGTCTLTIMQNLCVYVPIEFGASAKIGDLTVECKNISAEKNCTGCDATNSIARKKTTVTGY